MTVSFLGNMVMGGTGVKNMRQTLSWSEQVWQIYERYTGKPRPDYAPKPVGAK
jgi:hypothetical protein